MNCDGESVLLERRGCNGNIEYAAGMLEHLDGKVDAIGLGGANLFYFLGRRKYIFPAGQYLSKKVRHTPLVDGSGWKSTVELKSADIIPSEFGGKRALVVSVLDRYWLADALYSRRFDVFAGDAFFALKLPLLLPLSIFKKIGILTMPFLSRLPISYLYPAASNKKAKRPLFPFNPYKSFSITAGDFYFIRSCLPADLSGKILITSGLSVTDRELLRICRLSLLITTTPFLGNINPSANAVEAVLAALGATRENYIDYANNFGWLPRLMSL